MGPVDRGHSRVRAQGLVRPHAGHVAEAVQEERHARQAALRGPGLQDAGATRRPVYDWPLDQLRHRHARSKRPAAEALDRSRRRPALPTQRLEKRASALLTTDTTHRRVTIKRRINNKKNYSERDVKNTGSVSIIGGAVAQLWSECDSGVGRGDGTSTRKTRNGPDAWNG